MNTRLTYAVYAVFLLFLAVLYFFLYGFHAFHPTDDGFILGYAWRIYNGEIPHTDFICIRPPLSPYLHASTLLLPDSWQFPGNRLLFFIQISIIMALPALWAVFTRRIKLSWLVLALITIFFVLSIQNFPPMPWHTVDALMFSYLGLMFLLFSLDSTSIKTKCIYTVLASIGFVLSILCKQSFLPVWVLAGIGLTFAWFRDFRNSQEADRKNRFFLLELSYLGTAAVIAAAFCLWLIRVDALGAFLDQIVGSYGFKELVQIGFIDYFGKMTVFFLFGLALAAIISSQSLRTAKSETLPRLLKQHAMSLVLLILIAVAIVSGFTSFQSTGLLLFWLLLGLLVGHVFLWFRNSAVYGIDRSQLALYTGILVISWAGSISWGYNTPVLGLGPAFLIVAMEADRLDYKGLTRHRLINAVSYILIAAICVGSFYYLYSTKPYRDLERSYLTYNLADIHPKFGRVYTNRTTYERFEEIELLKSQYVSNPDTPYVIMPDFPIYYYIAGIENPLSIDWFLRPEHPDLESRLINELNEIKPIVFLQKQFGDPEHRYDYSSERYKDGWYYLPYWVYDNWEAVGEGEYFYIYTYKSAAE